MAVERGCGRRKKGGIYAEVGLSPYGRPIEEFLIDPPQRITQDIPHQGVLCQVHRNVLHLMDWVGAQYYPNVADFIEEARRYGISRRLPKSTPFHQLTPASRLLLVHPRAYIENRIDYLPAHWSCPCDKHDFGEIAEMCIGMVWHDLDRAGARMTHQIAGPEIERYVGDGLAAERQMPAFSYFGHVRPVEVEGVYTPALFASFPISRLVVVDGTPEETAEGLAVLDGAVLPYEVVPE